MAAIRCVSQNTAATRKLSSTSAMWRNAAPRADSTAMCFRRSTSSRNSTAKSAPRMRTISFRVPPMARSASSSPPAADEPRGRALTGSTARDEEARHETGDSRGRGDDSDHEPRILLHVFVCCARGGVRLPDRLFADLRDAVAGIGKLLRDSRLERAGLVATGTRKGLQQAFGFADDRVEFLEQPLFRGVRPDVGLDLAHLFILLAVSRQAAWSLDHAARLLRLQLID